MNRNALRMAAAALIAAPALGATASPAAAAPSTDRERTTELSASVLWIQYGDVPGARDGNVHIGGLTAFETTPGLADVSAFVTDLDCPAGLRPGLGSDTSGCTRVGLRSFQGTDLSLTATGGARTATLTGVVEGTYERNPLTEEEPPVDLGPAQVDLTWTVTGAPTHTRGTATYEQGGRTITERTRTTTRAADVRGQLGPVLLQDADDVEGTPASTRTTSRSS